MSEKEQRIKQLVALCVKNQVTPKKTVFCDFIIRVCATLYGYDKRTAKSYVDVLINSYRFNHWRNYVHENLYLEEGERNQWISLHLRS